MHHLILTGSFGVEIQKAVNARAKPSIDHKSMSEEQQNVLSVSDIKSILKYHHVDFSGAVEKQDLLDLLRSKLVTNGNAMMTCTTSVSSIQNDCSPERRESISLLAVRSVPSESTETEDTSFQAFVPQL
ncbi:hypothetical protein PROFUN_16382 [Planoprotostelium fungivorum]|uniref:SAP domain-containing protein n=1 Tax=Planoprotostelium fungivorum TaxID=1890364 RepID=A0A2P6MQP0_9EUKA|nr:hypothetical protein PROFUN_16382 [Planoprotostelium fungivorum]